MKTVNSPKLTTITRWGDECAFWEWLSFYRRNGLFPNLETAAKRNNVNVVAVVSGWPPDNPGAWIAFERAWHEYHFAANGATTLDAQEAVRKRFPLPDAPRYARREVTARKAFDDAKEAADKKRDQRCAA